MKKSSKKQTYSRKKPMTRAAKPHRSFSVFFGVQTVELIIRFEKKRCLLFVGVARTAHGAIRAAAAATAGGFSFFLVFYHIYNDSDHNGSQNQTNNYRCNVFTNPAKHSDSSPALKIILKF